MKGRMREDSQRWRGPATVIARKSMGRYYVGWRSRVLLVAKDQIRLATVEEAAAADTIAKDMAMTADQKFYRDVSGASAPERREEVPQVPTLTPALQDLPVAVRALQVADEDTAEKARQEIDQQLEAIMIDVAEDFPNEEVSAESKPPLPWEDPASGSMALVPH